MQRGKIAAALALLVALTLFGADYARTRSIAHECSPVAPVPRHVTFGSGIPDDITDVSSFDNPVQAPGTGEPANNSTFKRALQQLANRTRWLNDNKAATVDTSTFATTSYVDNRIRTARVTAKSHSDSPYALPSTVEILEVNSATGTFQVNLPAPAGAQAFLVADVGLSAASNFITLHRAGSEKIQGVTADFTLSTSGGVWFIWSNGSNWWVSGPT